jgi:L-asparaginase
MKVTILTTGGTIDKTYDEHAGSLRNEKTVLETILRSLRLPDLFIRHVAVMSKDSLEMVEADRERILREVLTAIPSSDAVVIVHGTDTLSKTGEYIYQHQPHPDIPIILTGAMRPYEFRDSDAQQNITEALFAATLAGPGIYAVMHNRLLPFPGVVKDRTSLTFRSCEEIERISRAE